MHRFRCFFFNDRQQQNEEKDVNSTPSEFFVGCCLFYINKVLIKLINVLVRYTLLDGGVFMTKSRRDREEEQYYKDRVALNRGGKYCAIEGCYNIVSKESKTGICESCWQKVK